MGLSPEAIQTFNNACKENYRIYHQRISQLESKVGDTTDIVKNMREIKQFQRELAAKGSDGRPKVSLFDFKNRQTRSGFFKRLNKLFSDVNQANKQSIQRGLNEIEPMIKPQSFDIRAAMGLLKEIQKRVYAVPKSDPEKKDFERRISAGFGKIKSPKSGQKASQNLDKLILSIEKEIKEIKRRIKSLGKPSLTDNDYYSSINALKQTHASLKNIQKKIQESQTEFRRTNLNGARKNHYWKKIQLLWESQSSCWGNPNLAHMSNFCEALTSANFQYFITKLENIEQEIKDNMTRGDIKVFTGKIKELETELRSEKNNVRSRPLKTEQHREFFGRTWACKQQMQSLWQGIKTASSAGYDAANEKILRLRGRMDKAKAKRELESVKEACRSLHKEIRASLAKNEFTPGQYHRLRTNIDKLFKGATEIIESIHPSDFSFQWLEDAYKRNIENRWTIFVKAVPPVAR